MSKESDDSELYDKLFNPIETYGIKNYECKLYVDAYSNVVIKEKYGEYSIKINKYLHTNFLDKKTSDIQNVLNEKTKKSNTDENNDENNDEIMKWHKQHSCAIQLILLIIYEY